MSLLRASGNDKGKLLLNKLFFSSLTNRDLKEEAKKRLVYSGF